MVEINKIGVFYDGNYFLHVSNYYKYSHEKKNRLSLSGLHRFIRNKTAELCGVDEHLCHIVDAHYFRGRVNAFDSRTQTIFFITNVCSTICCTQKAYRLIIYP